MTYMILSLVPMLTSSLWLCARPDNSAIAQLLKTAVKSDPKRLPENPHSHWSSNKWTLLRCRHCYLRLRSSTRDCEDQSRNNIWNNINIWSLRFEETVEDVDVRPPACSPKKRQYSSSSGYFSEPRNSMCSCRCARPKVDAGSLKQPQTTDESSPNWRNDENFKEF